MRLSTIQQHSIRESVERFLPGAKIMLYGSRADDSKRGGDIDLLVLTKDKFERSVQYKILAALYQRIGEQKIDLLIENPDKLSDFAQLISADAIPL
jgi:predicted nucleotidyltransferase